jgi:hypothetical protein
MKAAVSLVDCFGQPVDMDATIVGRGSACGWRFKRYRGHVIERNWTGTEYNYQIAGPAQHFKWYRGMDAVKAAIRQRGAA